MCRILTVNILFSKYATLLLWWPGPCNPADMNSMCHAGRNVSSQLLSLQHWAFTINLNLIQALPDTSWAEFWLYQYYFEYMLLYPCGDQGSCNPGNIFQPPSTTGIPCINEIRSLLPVLHLVNFLWAFFFRSNTSIFRTQLPLSMSFLSERQVAESGNNGNKCSLWGFGS